MISSLACHYDSDHVGRMTIESWLWNVVSGNVKSQRFNGLGVNLLSRIPNVLVYYDGCLCDGFEYLRYID